jgi:hypothetical protein
MNVTLSNPLPQARLGGEGWVRGQRSDVPQRVRSLMRCPLTPTLSPITHVMGEREQFAEAA